MSGIDTNLASKLKQAMSKPMSFAFVAKGSEGKLIVDRKKVSAKEIADARKEIGGGTIFKGRCVGEDGKLVFEVTKEPPGSLAAQLKKVIKTNAGLVLNVDFRVNASAESEEEEAEAAEEPSADQAPPPAPPVPSTGVAAAGGAKAIKRLNGLSAEIKTALAGPDGAQVRKLVGNLNDLLKKKDFDQVDKVLDELEALVRAGGS